MQPFSDTFKKRLVQRLVGPRAVSANALAKEVGISQESLSRWLRAARSVDVMTPSSKKPWTGADKLRVVTEARDLTGSALGAFLRREGLHDAQLTAWRAAAEAALGAPVRPRSGVSPEAKRIQELERELRRKDQALAETAALLVLKKKVQA
ncbi:MAG: IS3 family transposase, partial [Gemmatimonadaceae bacterium]